MSEPSLVILLKFDIKQEHGYDTVDYIVEEQACSGRLVSNIFLSIRSPNNEANLKDQSGELLV
jgi:hypothetical protein